MYLNANLCGLQYKRAKICRGIRKKILLSFHWLTFLVQLNIDIKRAPMTIFLIFKTIPKITSHTMLFIFSAPRLHALEYKKEFAFMGLNLESHSYVR